MAVAAVRGFLVRGEERALEIALAVVLFLVGIALIVKGGDFFVDAASWIAEVSGIPKIIIGATIVSVATTLPELIVSLVAAMAGKVDMSIGNAVGSVTANIGLIMGIALVCMPGAIRRKDFTLPALLMLAAAALVVASGLMGSVGIVISLCLLVIFAGFLAFNIISARRSTSEREEELVVELEAAQGNEVLAAEKAIEAGGRPRPDRHTVLVNAAKFILGAAGIIIGAQLLVDNGSALARFAGVSERIIGVTIIAVGTSLPELVTTVTAIAKKQSALSVGNIIGANVIDLTLILPLCALVSGQALPIASSSALVDLPACLLVALIAVVPTLIKGRLYRWQGFALLAVYVVYLILTCTVVAG